LKLISFHKKIKNENISITYIGLGPKIQIFVEAGPACLPLIHFPAAQLEAQHSRPVGGLRPHSAEAKTELSSSPTGEKSSPNLILNRIRSKSKQKMRGIGVRILHELLGGKSLYKEAARPDFGPNPSHRLCPSCLPSPL
jgi:hypothetical protein